MLFPNFYVPSVGCEDGGFLDRSRMSLSYPGGLEQALAQFHLRFTGKQYARRAGAVPGPSASSLQEGFERGRGMV